VSYSYLTRFSKSKFLQITEIKYLFEYSKQEIEKAQTEIREKEKEKQAKKNKRGTGRWIKAHQLAPARQPTKARPNLPFRSSSSTSGRQAARWSSA
jgi:hypothetical protein